MPEFFNNFNWEIFKKPNQSFRNVDYDPNAELNWDAHDWLSQRAENDRGSKYTEQDVEIFNSHVPEYKQIEQNSKSNGTWLQMPDGSRWVGDPREWVMMQSEAFKKNYQENPWYTGQAEWETQVTLPDGTVIDTDKVKRARYHNGEMWFSNDAGYAQYFADTVGREGLGIRGQFINNPNYKTDHNIRGTVFLAGIPKTGNYRKLEGPKTGYDHWRHMPFILTETGFKRTNEKTNLLTDDLVSHSRKLGDDGLFLFNVNDGPVLRNKYKENKMLPYFARPGHMNNDSNSRLETTPINEFISQPGFTEKIKFIRGNNGNFDPNTDDKYSAIFKIDSPLFAKKGGRIHIKKKNRGKFTESAKRAGMGVQEYARHVLANKDKYSSTLVKRANFARNAKKFKHENGGILKAQEGTGNLWTPHPLSPVGIALNQAKAMTKGKTHLPPGVKEVVGPDGQKIAIRTEQPLQPLEQNIAEWLPGTGDVAEVGYITDDVKNGRYGSAALAVGLMTIPGNAGKLLNKHRKAVSKTADAVEDAVRKADVSEYINTVDDALPERQPLTISKSKQFWDGTSESKLTDAEKAGIPKGERNNVYKPKVNSSKYFLESDQLFPMDKTEVISDDVGVSNMLKKYQLGNRKWRTRGLSFRQTANGPSLELQRAFTNDIEDFAKSLPDFDPRFAREDGVPSFYISQFRDYLGSIGYNPSSISDETLLKIITHQYNTLTKETTGKLKGRLFFHGTDTPFESFDYHMTGKNTGNMGYNGAGNYFSTYPTGYGSKYHESSFGREWRWGLNQPYVITGIKSTPLNDGKILPGKIGIPEYISNRGYRTKEGYNPIIQRAISIADSGNTRNMAIIDGYSIYPTVFFDKGNNIPNAEFSVSRNDGIKSLFPHPSRFIRNADGTVTLIPTDWNDARVNFKQGGKL